jgi:hypothetical protein
MIPLYQERRNALNQTLRNSRTLATRTDHFPRENGILELPNIQMAEGFYVKRKRKPADHTADNQ